MTYPWNRVLLVLAVLGVAAALFIPSWGNAKADWPTCSGEYECQPALAQCEADCDSYGLPPNELRQCKRACLRDYKDCTIAACAL